MRTAVVIVAIILSALVVFRQIQYIRQLDVRVYHTLTTKVIFLLVFHGFIFSILGFATNLLENILALIIGSLVIMIFSVEGFNKEAMYLNVNWKDYLSPFPRKITYDSIDTYTVEPFKKFSLITLHIGNMVIKKQIAAKDLALAKDLFQ